MAAAAFPRLIGITGFGAALGAIGNQLAQAPKIDENRVIQKQLDEVLENSSALKKVHEQKGKLLETKTRTQSYVHGDDRMVVRYYWMPDNTLSTLVVYGPQATGHPNIVHGGSIAAVLDDSLGTTAYLNGHPSVTGNLSVNYRKPLEVGKVYSAECRIESIERRKLNMLVRARIESISWISLSAEVSVGRIEAGTRSCTVSSTTLH
eukprot:TRINITY_DN2879_c1_g1::TRINITY_DN2879_c1_g1_i1::g.5343::m.5343 TRINITY_DN2879_c1_g1::TRINITY_DN2879_c1_g1_i1::g.5343  ORF type:complete len:219 (+),score=17.20,sp/Q5T1C6/THEM4_HUMAN/26.62/2e-10,4HBT/PF03061.17/5e-08,MaoC_dehydrat_N/PF13452.1/1.5e+03,MaoC_dehydrat_N/PF13452.1/0.41 TRINITY_DN2879_c1_g1_i1:42-659(+)